MTQSGRTNRRAGIVSHALSGRSLPVIQSTGASKCVPVCSPIRIVFQYHAGPFSSKREIVSIVTPGDDPNIGGRPMTGVSGPSGDVRSTTLIAPLASPAIRSLSTRPPQVLQVTLKLVPVLEQRQIGDEGLRSHRLHFGDQGREIAGAGSVRERHRELLDRPHGRGPRYARSLRDG